VKIRRLKSAVVERNFDWIFVRIETDDGIRGLGECFFAAGLTSQSAVVAIDMSRPQTLVG
jgi:L-alanine-DL-glutamate epimerase-like enolase superfamily enzyme